MNIRLIILSILLVSFKFVASELDFNYHNYDQFTLVLKNYSINYPTKTYLHSIGKSVQGLNFY